MAGHCSRWLMNIIAELQRNLSTVQNVFNIQLWVLWMYSSSTFDHTLYSKQFLLIRMFTSTAKADSVCFVLRIDLFCLLLIEIADICVTTTGIEVKNEFSINNNLSVPLELVWMTPTGRISNASFYYSYFLFNFRMFAHSAHCTGQNQYEWWSADRGTNFETTYFLTPNCICKPIGLAVENWNGREWNVCSLYFLYFS